MFSAWTAPLYCDGLAAGSLFAAGRGGALTAPELLTAVTLTAVLELLSSVIAGGALPALSGLLGSAIALTVT
jgi:hypothetical protein